MKHAGKRSREFLVDDRLGGDRVHRAADLAFRRVEHQAYHVVQVHPGHPVAAVAEPPAEAELERQEHPSERPAPRPQHHAVAHRHHAKAKLARAPCFRFPRH